MEQQLEEVRAWLLAGEQAEYQAGVLLLQRHAKNRGLVAHLLRKESASNREKLTYELVKVGCEGRLDEVSEVMNHFAQAVQGATCAVRQVADVLTQEEFPAQPEPSGPVPDAVRGQVDALTQLMSRLYNQRCQLSNRLFDLDPADGPKTVGEILSLQNQYNALAQKRRNLVEGGQPAAPEVAAAPPEAPTEPAPAADAPVIDRAALLQQRQNLRSNISKSRKKAEEAKTEEKRSEHQQKVAKWEVELQTVEMQLAQPQA